MQLNLSTDYALRILLHLSGQKEGISSADISKHIGIQREFTLKILRQLKEGGFVKASRGKSGGYMLRRSPEEILLYDVLNHMEDTMFVNRCIDPNGSCSIKGFEKTCSFYQFFKSFQKRMEEQLRGTTLQNVIDHSGMEHKHITSETTNCS